MKLWRNEHYAITENNAVLEPRDFFFSRKKKTKQKVFTYRLDYTKGALHGGED